MDVGGRTVVDVGAGVGDTAILFALRGARRVVALEPYPSLYGEALINIRANGVEDKVALINAGLGSFDGEVCASLNNVNGYMIFKPSNECGARVRMYTLSSLIKEFNIEDGSILKMDCEGCEFDVVLNDYDHVKLFKEVVLNIMHMLFIGLLLSLLTQ